MAKEKLERKSAFKGTGSKVTGVVTVDDVNKYVGDNKKLIKDIPINDIVSPSFHDRKTIDESGIIELANNIKEVGGLMQPIVVRTLEDGSIERMIGYRRIRAYQHLGWDKIPAVNLGVVSNEMAIMIMLSENIQRENLNVYDKTVGIMEYIGIATGKNFEEVKSMLYEFRNFDSKNKKPPTKEDNERREKVEEITQRLGNITVASMINRLKIFALKEEILEALKADKINYTVAVELNKIEGKELVHEYIGKVEAGELSLKDIKEIVKQKNKEKNESTIRYRFEELDSGEVAVKFENPLSEKQIEKLDQFLSTL